MNEHWTRWIFASVTKYIKEHLTTPSIIEGQHKGSELDEVDRVEIRLDGPIYSNPSHGWWKAYIEVNLLIQSVINDTDFHCQERIIGECCSALAAMIPIYKYGGGDDDDDSLLGCMKLVSNRKDEDLIVSRFGQLKPSIKLNQAMVECHYDMEFNV